MFASRFYKISLRMDVSVHAAVGELMRKAVPELGIDLSAGDFTVYSQRSSVDDPALSISHEGT